VESYLTPIIEQRNRPTLMKTTQQSYIDGSNQQTYIDGNNATDLHWRKHAMTQNRALVECVSRIAFVRLVTILYGSGSQMGVRVPPGVR